MRLASLFLVLWLSGCASAPSARPAFTLDTGLVWVSAWCGMSPDDGLDRALCAAEIGEDAVVAWKCAPVTKETKGGGEK